MSEGKNLKGREIGEGLHQRKSDGLYEAKYRARDGKRIVKRYNGRIKPIIGDMLLGDVKSLHCQMVINNAEKLGDTTGSARKLRVIMREFFESAKDNEMIPTNPVSSSVSYTKHDQMHRMRYAPEVFTEDSWAFDT